MPKQSKQHRHCCQISAINNIKKNVPVKICESKLLNKKISLKSNKLVSKQRVSNVGPENSFKSESLNEKFVYW